MLWSAWSDNDEDDHMVVWAWIRGDEAAVLFGDRVYVQHRDGVHVRVRA
jgi:hypothetical protein